MDEFAELTGRPYHLFDYVGHPEAERVDRHDGLGRRDGARDGRVDGRQGREGRRASRSASTGRSRSRQFVAALPKSVKAIAVLDRTKEPGAVGEPLYLDVVAALREAKDAGLSPFAAGPDGRRRPLRPLVEGVHAGDGQGGLRRAGREPAPEEPLHRRHRRRRDAPVAAGRPRVRHRAGRRRARRVLRPRPDGTVGANKNSIKIIGEETENYAQGYFVYDSKKAGAITISHLRFGPRPIRSPYLIKRANFVACHQFVFLERYDVLGYAAPGGGVPAQRAVRAGRGLGPAAARGPAGDDREEAQVLRDRRLRGGQGDRHGRAHQHHHADLLLRDLRRAAARGGHRADQEDDQEDLRQEGRRRSSRRTTPPWTRRSPTCTRSRSRRRSPRRAAGRRSSPTRRPTSSSASRR